MSPFKLPTLVLFAGLLLAGCDSANLSDVAEQDQSLNALSKGMPSDGNTNKEVASFNESWSVDCGGGAILDVDFWGWAQFKLFSPNTRQVELDVWHVFLLYENESGETFLWKDRGPDHFYFDQNGDFIWTITGRASGSGVVGHVVINLTAGETILVAGIDHGSIDDLACSTLY